MDEKLVSKFGPGFDPGPSSGFGTGLKIEDDDEAEMDPEGLNEVEEEHDKSVVTFGRFLHLRVGFW